MRLSARFPLLLGATFLVACGEPAPDAAPVGDALPPQPLADAPAPPPRLGLWVLCEGSQRVLEHPDRVPLLVDQALALGATDLFVQVYRGGRAWFRSSYADPLPYEIALVASEADPLARLIGLAHAAGLRVHAWVNVLSLASNRDAPVLHALGPGAVSVDRRGRSILEFPKLELPPPDSAYLRMGTPAVWLDPAAPGVADWLASTFSELVENYPSLDGIHFDYIRYPDVLPFTPGSRFRVGLDFGYGAASRARFERETGLRAPSRDSSANGDAWDQWRRERVADILREVRARTLRAKPDLLFSAAVSAWSYTRKLSIVPAKNRLLALFTPTVNSLNRLLTRVASLVGAPW